MKKLIISILTALILVAVMAMPAVAVEDTQTVPASVSVNDVVSITLAGGISFGSVVPPVVEQGTTGQVDGSPSVNITIESETNVEVDVGIMGTITAGTNLTLDNWKYSTVFETSLIGLTGSYAEVYSDQAASGSAIVLNFYHYITVPDGTPSGLHTVDVSYKAQETTVGFP